MNPFCLLPELPDTFEEGTNFSKEEGDGVATSRDWALLQDAALSKMICLYL